MPWTESYKIIETKPSTIERIILSEKESTKLDHILQSNKMGQWSKNIQTRKLIGSCISCSGVPSFKVTFHYEGLSKIERYCEKCLPKEYINQK